jgi:hypothetical protein
MSTKATKANSGNKVTKYCPVCAKKGFPEEVYTSHNVRETRDPSSRVTCPTIKFNKCGICGTLGHFAGSCRVTKKEKVVAPIQKNVVKVANRFAFSESDSEEETDPKAEPAELANPDSDPTELEPKKKSRAERVKTDEFTIQSWQDLFEDILKLPEAERVIPALYYWDETNQKIIRKGYEILQVKEGLFLRSRSWADDSDDEYDSD